MNTKIEDFEVAHKSHFATALDEIKRGRKLTHWMWYIFPQIYGLGTSDMAKRYAICSLDEATAFAEHNALGENLRNISGELLYLQGLTASQIFGNIDAQKLQSSMTLFDAVCPKCGGALKIRTSYRGLFWGCENYPKCSHTESIDINNN